MRSASTSIQMQHAVAPSSVRWPSARRATLVVPAKTNATPASSAALTSFGVRGTQRWCGHRFDASVAAQSARWLRAALQSAAVQVQGGGFSARVVAAPSGACSQVGQAASSAVLSRLSSCAASGKMSSEAPVQRGFCHTHPRVSRTVGQCHQQIRRCLTLHSSGAPTALRAGHQAQGLRPILRLLSAAQCRRVPLNSNVRLHTQLYESCRHSARPMARADPG
jgi:hypothetical protein